MTTHLSSQKHPVPPDRYAALLDKLLAEHRRAERRRKLLAPFRWLLSFFK